MTLRLLVFSKAQIRNNGNRIIIRSIATSSSNYNTKPATATIVQGPKPVARGKKLVNGVKLYWEKFGTGSHVALLLPGLVGSIQDNFHPIIPKMDLEKYTLIGWDPPGYGKSRPPDREIFTEEFCLSKDAKLAHTLMKELGYDNFSTIGWSNGGTTGALIAAHFPDSVRKVVMCNCPLKINSHSNKIMKVMVDLANWTPSQRKAVLRTYGTTYATKMLNDWKKFNEDNSGNDEFVKYISEEMKKVTAPTLFIKSKGDIVAPMGDAEELGRLIPDFTIERVSVGGHDHLEFIGDFVRASQSFLSQ